MTEIVAGLNELLQPHTGCDVGMFDRKFILQIIDQRVTATQTGNIGTYLAWLESTPEEASLFTRSLYISYSEFFRNPLSFAALWKLVLPGLLQQHKSNHHREIRIWSAACAGGQEAYSLAMLLEALNGMNGSHVNYRIFATDLSENVLQAAREGIFDASLLQNVPLNFIEAWFTRQNGSYKVNPMLKEHISFSTYDLLSKDAYCPPDCVFGDFDLVLCCNLLFYYNPEIRKMILDKLTRCLRPGGFLMTGEAEREIIPKRRFTEIFPSAALFIKKPQT